MNHISWTYLKNEYQLIHIILIYHTFISCFIYFSLKDDQYIGFYFQTLNFKFLILMISKNVLECWGLTNYTYFLDLN